MRYLMLSGDRELAQELRLARQSGMPITPADMRRNPPDVSNNANASYVEAVGIYTSARSLLLAVNSDNPAVTRKEIAKTKGLEDILNAAAAKPRYDPGYQWEKGLMAEGLYRTKIRDLAKLAALIAIAEADLGQYERSLEMLILARTIGSHLGQVQNESFALTSRGVELTVAKATMHCLRKLGRDREVLLAFKSFVDSYEGIRDQRYYLGGEAVLAQADISLLSSSTQEELAKVVSFERESEAGYERDPPNVQDRVTGFRIKLPGFIPGVRAMVLREYRLLWQDLGKNPTDLMNMKASFEASKRREGKLEGDRVKAGRLFLLDQYFFNYNTVANAEALKRVQKTAVRILLDQLETGHLPKTLPDYGELSIDPFGSKPLQYRRDGTGFMLYSIGEDEVDNGGDFKKDRGLFTWPNRPKAQIRTLR